MNDALSARQMQKLTREQPEHGSQTGLRFKLGRQGPWPAEPGSQSCWRFILATGHGDRARNDALSAVKQTQKFT